MGSTGSGENQIEQNLLTGQAQIWDQLFNFTSFMSLQCAIQLGIPDIIHKYAKPMPLSALVDALCINKDRTPCISRLMRILVHSGIFIKSTIFATKEEEEEAAAYSLAPASLLLLLKDEPFMSVAPIISFNLHPVMMKSWQNMSKWLQSSDDDNPKRTTPFETAHGKTFWEYAAQEACLNNTFNGLMASDAKLVSSVMLSNYKTVFQGLNSIVDVGGGTGTMAKAIANAFPEMKCIVFDLPHVVQGLEGSENLKFVGGDMFEWVPPADAILLKWILHDWNDEECVKILKNCKEAIVSKGKIGGKLIVIEMVLDEKKKDEDSIKAEICFDVMMMNMLSGRERGEKEYAELFFEAGFPHYSIAPVLGVRSVIQVFP